MRRLRVVAVLLVAAGCEAGEVTTQLRADAAVDAALSSFPDARVVDAAVVVDAAAPPPDAPPRDARPADAPAPPIDAPPPDAATCGNPTTQELLGNRGFDQSTGSGAGATITPWTQNGPIVWTAAELMGTLGVSPHQGGYAAYLGGVLNANDILLQPVTVPAGTIALRLSGQRRILTTDTTTARNSLRFQLVDGSGQLLTTIRSYTNVDATADWTAFTQPVMGSFAGQAVRLRIVGATDNVLATKFLVDTLSLEATVCP